MSEIMLDLPYLANSGVDLKALSAVLERLPRRMTGQVNLFNQLLGRRARMRANLGWYEPSEVRDAERRLFDVAHSCYGHSLLREIIAPAFAEATTNLLRPRAAA